jgi:hypothetical protein
MFEKPLILRKGRVAEGMKRKSWRALMDQYQRAAKKPKPEEPEYVPVDAAALERAYALMWES